MADLIAEARKVFEIEARAILGLKDRLNGDFAAAVSELMQCQGKVVLTGIGKSGVIARKIASTMSSTGTPALYVHPAEGSHGDLGVISSGDVVVALSYSGSSEEMINLTNYVARKEIPLVAMTGKPQSPLANAAKLVLDVGISEEACPLGLAPTASTTASLAMGDALAMALLLERGFSPEDFAEFHPGGQLGRRLITTVKDVMHSGEALPLVSKSTAMKKVVYAMTSKEVRGVAGVLDDDQVLVGVITDGDLRRKLDRSENPLEGTAGEIMSHSPKVIDCSELAQRALFVMEEFSIQNLFVLDKTSDKPRRPVGVLHLQDLLAQKIR